MKKSNKVITVLLLGLAAVAVPTVYFCAKYARRWSVPYSSDVLASVRAGETVTVGEVTERLGHPRHFKHSTKWDMVFTDETLVYMQERQQLYVKTSPDGLRIIDAKVVEER